MIGKVNLLTFSDAPRITVLSYERDETTFCRNSSIKNRFFTRWDQIVHIDIRNRVRLVQKARAHDFVDREHPKRAAPGAGIGNNHSILARCFGHAKRMSFGRKIRSAKWDIAAEQDNNAGQIATTKPLAQPVREFLVGSGLGAIKDDGGISILLFYVIGQPVEYDVSGFTIANSRQRIAALQQRKLCLGGNKADRSARDFKIVPGLLWQFKCQECGAADQTGRRELCAGRRQDDFRRNLAIKEQGDVTPISFPTFDNINNAQVIILVADETAFYQSCGHVLF
ncbi:hypothetical protein [Roseovarius aestuarii]|uniref:hypothetical protein n=1 Tax=Roseovarius aestuarii TaxID=475083 RepID=UPI001CBFAE5C|nr:hypothetical protein [Roseovarius aestuarii]